MSGNRSRCEPNREAIRVCSERFKPLPGVIGPNSFQSSTFSNFNPFKFQFFQISTFTTFKSFQFFTLRLIRITRASFIRPVRSESLASSDFNPFQISTTSQLPNHFSPSSSAFPALLASQSFGASSASRSRSSVS
jgi:hypothetical protein